MKPLSILTVIATAALLAAGCKNPIKDSHQFGRLLPVPQGSLSDGHFLGDIYDSPDLSGLPRSQLKWLKDFDRVGFMARHRAQAPDMGGTSIGATTNELNLQLKEWLKFRFGKSEMEGVTATFTNVVIYTLPSAVFDTEIHPRLRWDSATALTGKYYVAKLVQASEGVLTLTNTSSTGVRIDTGKVLNTLASGGVQVAGQAGQNYHFKLKAPTFIYYQMERIPKDAPYALKDIPSESKTFNYNYANKHYTDRHRRFGVSVNIETKVWLSVTDTQIVVNAKSDVHAVTPLGAEPRIRLEIEAGISQKSIPFTLPSHLKSAGLYEPERTFTELKALSVRSARPFDLNQKPIQITPRGPVAQWSSFEVEGEDTGPNQSVAELAVRLTPLVIKAQITGKP
jgi:hypothetical protein